MVPVLGNLRAPGVVCSLYLCPHHRCVLLHALSCGVSFVELSLFRRSNWWTCLAVATSSSSVLLVICFVWPCCCPLQPPALSCLQFAALLPVTECQQHAHSTGHPQRSTGNGPASTCYCIRHMCIRGIWCVISPSPSPPLPPSSPLPFPPPPPPSPLPFPPPPPPSPLPFV